MTSFLSGSLRTAMRLAAEGKEEAAREMMELYRREMLERAKLPANAKADDDG